MHTFRVGFHVNSAAFCLAACLTGASLLQAQEVVPPADWQRQELNLRITGGNHARAVYFPSGRSVASRANRQAARLSGGAASVRPAIRDGVTIATIDSPPLDGFVPWVAVIATDKHGEALDAVAVPQDAVTGQPFVADPTTQYAIGLYDTGASSTVIGYESANALGLYAADQITANTVTVSGVTGSVVCYSTMPFGLFIDGLQAIDPESLALNTDAMIGESNYSAIAGPEPEPGAPDLFTAIGTPIAVYFHAVFRNDQPVTRIIGGKTYSAPSIRAYSSPTDPNIPVFPNSLPLDLRPDGSMDVEYLPCFPDYYDCNGEDTPMYPSMLGMLGWATQSLFFSSNSMGMDLSDDGYAWTYYKFMLDTGSQLTVIGSTVVARLHLDTSTPDFWVEVQGVDGTIVLKPGFYLDAIDIPAVGDWLSFTNVPVVYLNVTSPETGYLDGIIGMNLLENYNFVMHGGGLLGGDGASLDFEAIKIFGDSNGDFDVDDADYAAFKACFRGPNIPSTGEGCPDFDSDDDGDVDQSDFGAFQNCYSGGLRADPACNPVP